MRLQRGQETKKENGGCHPYPPLDPSIYSGVPPRGLLHPGQYVEPKKHQRDSNKYMTQTAQCQVLNPLTVRLVPRVGSHSAPSLIGEGGACNEKKQS